MPTNTWNNGGGDGLWFTAGNWTLGHVPLPSEDVVFDGTSSANCTIAANATVNSIDATAWSVNALLTSNGSLTHSIAGKFKWNTSANGTGGIVFGNGTIWNVGGDFGGAGGNSINGVNTTGATINLTGTGNNLGSLLCAQANAEAPYGVLNIQAGATYTTAEAGVEGFVQYIVVNVYGTWLGGEIVGGHDPGANPLLIPTDLHLKPGGSIANAPGTLSPILRFGYNCRLYLDGGSLTLNECDLYSPYDGYAISSGTIRSRTVVPHYANPIAPAANAHVSQWNIPANTVINFTADGDGAGSSWAAATQSVGTVGWGWILNPGVQINISHQTINWQITGQTAQMNWTDLGGWVRFLNCASFTPPIAWTSPCTCMGRVEFAGGTPTLHDNYSGTTLLHTGGTFSANGKNLTLQDDWRLTGGNFTASGFAGTTVTVNGCIALHGTAGNVLLLNPASGWTLALPTHPDRDNTYVIEHATIANLTVTGGGTLYAVNCTDGGGNTGVTFTNTSRPSNAVLLTAAPTLASGARVLEAGDLGGGTRSFLMDGVKQFTIQGMTLYQGTAHGPCDFFDANYQVCLIDNLNIIGANIAPLQAPTIISVTTTGAMTFTGVVGASSGYAVYRGPHGGSLSQVATVAYGAGWTWQDPSPPSGNTDYQLFAVNGTASSAGSNVVTVAYPILKATFAGTNGASLAGYVAETGQTVNIISGTWAFLGSHNANKTANNSTWQYLLFQAAAPPFPTSLVLTINANGFGNLGPIWRADAAGQNFFFASWNSVNLIIYQVTAGGAPVQKATVAMANPGDPFTITVTDDGTNMTAKVGSITVSFSSTAFNTNTYAGVASFYAGVSQNFGNSASTGLILS